MEKKLIRFIVFVFLGRVILSALLPLGIDESYYLLYAKYPEVHYYDHPFMTGWLVNLFTNGMKWAHPVFYRLPSVISSILSSIVIFKLGCFLKDKTAGWLAVLMYTASFYASVIAGVFVMPDGFMVFFWITALYLAIRFFLDEKISDAYRNELLMWFGFFAGCAMASKLHAVFLWVGFAAYALVFQRSTLLKPRFWISMLISAVVLIPMLLWNAQNDWLHFRFYSGRVAPNEGLKLMGLVKEWIGEVAYQNPLVFFSVIAYGVLSLFAKPIRKESILLLFFSAPLLLFIWVLALFKETLPHWSGPAYFGLILIAAVEMASASNKTNIQRLSILSLVLCLTLVIVGVIFIHFYPGTIGKKDSPLAYGQNDFTLDMYGWKKSGLELASVIREKRMSALPVYADNWFPAAHLDEYVCKPSGNKLFGVGDVKRIHQYQWINQRRGGIPKGDSALYISVSNYPAHPLLIYGDRFESIVLVDSVEQTRVGKTTRFFHLYLMTGRK